MGAALIIDAARRVRRIPDLGIWGLVLDAENEDLLKKVYAPLNFKRGRGLNPGDPPSLVMYAPLSAFPE